MEIPGLGMGSPPMSAATETFTRSSQEQRVHFTVIRFMFEAATKLNLKPVPQATAAHLYHRVFNECQLSEFDPHLIGTTCLYLAGKIEEDHKRLRDVINVCYRCLHKDKPALDIGSTYWALRESLMQCELFVLRVLKFQVVVSSPHKYLLHYIKSLSTWLPPEVVSRVPFAHICLALLRDSYHGNMCLKYPAEWMAVSVLYLAMQCHGVQVPHNEDAEYRWWEAFVEDMKLEDIRKIICEIINTYNLETMLT